MRERIRELERRVDELSRRIDRISRILESSAPVAEVPAAASPAEEAVAPSRTADPEWSIGVDFESLIARHGLVFLAGLVSLVLAGAMVLRVVTISSPVPLVFGAALGLVYCAFLLFVAERKLRAGKLLHGDTFALLAVMILDVLLVEATLREGGFDRRVSFAVLAASLGVLSLLAIRRSRVVPFTVGLLVAPAVAFAIGGKPFLHPWFAGILVVTLLAAEQGRRARGWSRARWGPGLVTLLYLMVLGYLGSRTARADLPAHAWAEPAWALSILAVFFLVIVLPKTIAAVYREQPLDGWEITMGVATAALVLIGSVSVLTGRPGGHVTAGLVASALSLLYYLASAMCFRRFGSESESFYTLAAIAFVHALVAFPVLLGLNATLAFSYQVLALVLAFFAARLGKKSLSLQAHLLTFLGFAVLGATEIRLVPVEGSAPEGTLFLMATGVLAFVAFARLRSLVPAGEGFRLDRLRPEAIALAGVLAVAVLEILAGLPQLLFPLALRIPGLDEEAVRRTLPTLLLPVGGVATLALGIRLRRFEAALLAVGLMGVGGLKLALDSLKVPGPYAAVAAAWFGIALLLSSVLYRRGRGLGPEPPAPQETESKGDDE